ncbi:MAG TPA: tRNA 4-thiouridine(8) synthase ThiI, partial [Thermoprotei archaeon]|nr:tRNA 4-thiouridine(8) synthase ThiI [Thermoprotei archaeon]
IISVTLDFSKKFLRKNMSFAVRVRRVKSYPYTSIDVERILGSKIIEKYRDINVDLKNPNVTIYVEIREKYAYIFKDIYPGAGGLPYGVEGKVLSLFSGGVDSLVASWMIMKRGCMLGFLHFKLSPYYSNLAFKRFNDAILWTKEWIPRKRIKVFLIDLGKIHSEINDIDSKYRCILCKALMYVLGEKVALENGFKGLVTGESMGQVASQTLNNLIFLSSLVKIPIFRPLIGFDKEEIMMVARKIGAYSIAARNVGKCLLRPSKPATRIERLDIIEKISNYTEYYGENYRKYLEVKYF